MRTETSKKLERRLWLYYAIVVIIVLLFTFGCTSKSNELAKIKPEKVVVLNSNTHKSGALYLYQYKVKRIEKGVIDVIYDERLFEKGDTIYHRFNN